MTIYDSRHKPDYGNFRAERRYGENPYILKWRTPSQDELLGKQIAGPSGCGIGALQIKS